ncbi:methionine S-methyltransferase isoform X1 [Impatiens glandulifera]|uniref:methionine S-methyltransferase isoform X1 n=1 Tax=Impatiens glandulifera TaxID=253017 RepID=UPI001FB190C8|nr:methionine S-methyltransferase isoform X1 [Impatiens glandulifera]
MAVKGLWNSIDEFLNQCKQSGDTAYAALRSLLERLENPDTRTEARIFLSHLQKRFPTKEESDQCIETFHFQIQDIYLEQAEGYQKRKKLTMMVIPSIFMPEDWSFTFYEGLNRHPETIFRDKTVSELGCGNGWISIAIAEKWLPSKVYGLDINPRAIKISWINLYLNALDENGALIFDSEGKTLLDRVEFHESDLLGYCRDNHIELERIIGCIPQILNPNPDAMSKLITENASEEFLYSLSNYCALQGFVEDQFGLGLIARAVEEGISVIKPLGIMIFNIGGRPGQGVCKRLFERRGVLVNKMWQTKILQVFTSSLIILYLSKCALVEICCLQAADTDISALVEIEKNSRHRFEFFMGITGDQPICARTAWAYGKAGGRISHALSVYSCQIRQPNQVKTIFEFLKNGYHDISNSLDLSFVDDSVADEKISFLAYLASMLKEISYLPYEPPAGSKRFRNLIADFMKTYHHVPLTADNVVVFPSRAAAIENALRLFSPRLAIVDEHLSRHLPRKWLTSLAIQNSETEDTLTVIEAPRQSDLMIELIKKLKPQVVVTGIASFEAITSSAFQHLLDATREIGSRLFLDISDHFELSSLPSANGVLKYLSGTYLPSHAAIICGLLKNQVYSDLEVAFVISEEESIFKAMSRTVELLEGNTASISQHYYGRILHDLLAFQLSDRHPPAERQFEKEKAGEMIGFASSAISVLKDAELSVTSSDKIPLIHMDVDKSYLPMPFSVKAAIFESFARQNVAESETDVTTAIQNFVNDTYGFSTDSSSEVIYSDCQLPLLNKLALCCIQEGGTLCFPSGSNGNFVSASRFLKANVFNIPTISENGFKLSEDVLVSALETVNKPWLYLCGPTINPTGLIYSNEELEIILSVCAKIGARVIIDTSFSGLEFDAKNSDAWDLTNILNKLHESSKPSFCTFLLGELSLKTLTGGLTFGFLVLGEPDLIDEFHSLSGLSKPHKTLKYSAKKLLELRGQKSSVFMTSVEEQKQLLKIRSKRLKETLEKCGWDVIESHGGISMLAKPSVYLGKTIKLNGGGDDMTNSFESNLDDDSNIREAMLKSTGLCIYSGKWTGAPGYCRFTYALEESQFESALDCILKFKDIVNI